MFSRSGCLFSPLLCAGLLGAAFLSGVGHGLETSAKNSSVTFTPAARYQDAATTSVPVYISDFELFSVTGSPARDPNPGGATKKPPPPKDAPPAVFELYDIPSVQARRLTDFFSTTLVEAFQKAGYTANRQSGSNPSSGVLLRGVFAEPDPSNRIRRAMLGGGVPGAKLLLYVGTFNLARPDQRLYEPAPVANDESRFGPVITLNTYVPLVKFELSKNPTEDEVRKISAAIVQNLTTLLKTNPAAFGQ